MRPSLKQKSSLKKPRPNPPKLKPNKNPKTKTKQNPQNATENPSIPLSKP